MYKKGRLAVIVAAFLMAGASVGALVSYAPAALAADAPAAAAPAAAAAAPKSDLPAAPPVAKEIVKVDNPYGLEALWKTGDFVAKGTLMILVIMSMGSWYILVTKFYEQLKMFRQAAAARTSFDSARTVQEGVNNLEAGNAFRYIAESALEASQRHGNSIVAKIDQHTWITMQIQRATENVQNRLQDGLAFLATVGSTAPFVGLFGTVWGIYHALTAIGIAGQASIDKVAGPVGEALIMTAIGLAVAVPAVLGYNWLVRRNKVAMEKIRTFSADVHAVLMVGENKGA
ncbi:MAG: MotA/TolQ/ExbB proton channel family protein [Rhodocyclales bacterium]|nr:MotA/TolQ/ExbB proton channel family protein [Rhodocyclales bacterium]